MTEYFSRKYVGGANEKTPQNKKQNHTRTQKHINKQKKTKPKIKVAIL